MGGETENIAKISEIVSKQIFNEFFWEISGPMNSNWSCINEDHCKKQHPSDIVFSYLEPYSNIRTYLNCDLKSYAKGSINKNSIKTAIENLSLSISCAETSLDWQKKYKVHPNNFEVNGLLFIYNHDGEFDKDFSRILDLSSYDNNLPLNRRIYILGPKDICYLLNIVNDIKRLRGDNLLPNSNDYQFFYPDLISKKVVSTSIHFGATVEMLLGPFQIIRYRIPNDTTSFGLMLYYRNSGKHIEEFIYIFDYLFHYQQLKYEKTITICLSYPDKDAAATFENAKKQYFVKFDEDEAILERLKIINYRSLTNVITSFSEIEIGMRYEN